MTIWSIAWWRAATSTKEAASIITKNIAIRFSGTGIRCNAVALGETDTLLACAIIDRVLRELGLHVGESLGIDNSDSEAETLSHIKPSIWS